MSIVAIKTMGIDTTKTKTMGIDRWGSSNNGLCDNVGRGLVGGNASLGHQVAHIVSGGLDDGSSLVVGDTNGDSSLAKHGSLHGIGVGLVSSVGKVAAQPVALDDGRVMGRGTDSYGGRHCIRHNSGRGHSGQADEETNRVHGDAGRWAG